MIHTVSEIETDHLRLMPIGLDDYDYLVSVHRQSWKMVFDDVDTFDSDEELRRYIDNILSVSAAGWIICDKKSEIQLGTAYLVDILVGITANFHPVLDVLAIKDLSPKDESGNPLKIMDEASRSAIVYSMGRFNLQRIGGAFGAHNVRAIRLCERLGFRKEGVIRNGLRLHGKPLDMIILGILKEETEAWLSAQLLQS